MTKIARMFLACIEICGPEYFEEGGMAGCFVTKSSWILDFNDQILIILYQHSLSVCIRLMELHYSRLLFFEQRISDYTLFL